MKPFLVLFVTAFALLSSFGAPRGRVQNQQAIDLNGVWKIRGNKYDDSKEVCIKQTGQAIEARFFIEQNGGCPIEGSRGGVFLKGTGRDTWVKGTIYLCTTVNKLKTDCGLPGWYSSEFDGTAKQDAITFHVRMDYVRYEVSPTGQWTNCRVTPQGGTPLTITLTRQPCPQDTCSYQVTHKEVQRAVLKALSEHNLKLGPQAEQMVAASIKNGASGTVFIIPLDAPIVVIGEVSVSSCTSPGGARISVRLMIWQTRKSEDGKGSDLYKMLQDVRGQGDFNQNGLDQAMKSSFDQTNLEQYKKPPAGS